MIEQKLENRSDQLQYYRPFKDIRHSTVFEASFVLILWLMWFLSFVFLISLTVCAFVCSRAWNNKMRGHWTSPIDKSMKPVAVVIYGNGSVDCHLSPCFLSFSRLFMNCDCVVYNGWLLHLNERRVFTSETRFIWWTLKPVLSAEKLVLKLSYSYRFHAK